MYNTRNRKHRGASSPLSSCVKERIIIGANDVYSSIGKVSVASPTRRERGHGFNEQLIRNCMNRRLEQSMERVYTFGVRSGGSAKRLLCSHVEVQDASALLFSQPCSGCQWLRADLMVFQAGTVSNIQYHHFSAHVVVNNTANSWEIVHEAVTSWQV